jgi:FkbM family methyltransferase
MMDVSLRGRRARFRIRAASSDLDCLEKVFVAQEYHVPFPLDPKVIVDGGANIGASAMYFSLQYPQAQVLALEPEPSNFELLKLNCASRPQISPINAALWPRPERLSFKDQGAEKWAFAMEPAGDQGPCLGKTVDDLMQEHGLDRIDILKLDIEGSERELFSARPLVWLDGVDLIIIELHDRFVAGCAQSFYGALEGRRFRQEVNGENIFILLGDPAGAAASCRT